MMFARTCRILAAFALLACTMEAQSIDVALSRMDSLAKTFRGASVDVRKYSFTYFAKETDEESGRMMVLRPSAQDTRMLAEFTKPAERAVSFAKNKVQLYYPKLNTVQEYNLGKEARLVDQYLLLGFGSAGSELRKSYGIKYVELANLDSGKAHHLYLEPKTAEARDQVRGIDLWINEPGGYPVRMKILQPSKDYLDVHYSNVKINPASVTEATVKLKLPKGVKKETPQK